MTDLFIWKLFKKAKKKSIFILQENDYKTRCYVNFLKFRMYNVHFWQKKKQINSIWSKQTRLIKVIILSSSKGVILARLSWYNCLSINTILTSPKKPLTIFSSYPQCLLCWRLFGSLLLHNPSDSSHCILCYHYWILYFSLHCTPYVHNNGIILLGLCPTLCGTAPGASLTPIL